MPNNIETDKVALATLHWLTEAQIQEVQGEPSLRNRLVTRKALFNSYKLSPKFAQTYGEAAKYFLMPFLADQEEEEARKYLTGALCEDLAYFYTTTNLLSNNQVLLSPGRTFKFYSTIHPNARVVENPMGVKSLEGISVPDGLVIQRSTDPKERIVRICEYTANGNHRQYFEGKYQGFEIDKWRLPQFFGDAELLFVIPQHKTKPTIVDQLGVRLERMPFGYEQLRDRVDSIYRFHIPYPDSATLADIHDRAKRQWVRAINQQIDREIELPLSTDNLDLLSRLEPAVLQSWELQTLA